MSQNKILIQDRAEEIQKEMFDFINSLKEKKTDPKISYQDLANVFFIQKIAQLTLENDFLRSEINEIHCQK